MPSLTPQDLRLLAPLRFAPRRSFAGRMRGERLSRKKGISIEFADYRDYVSGDDLRHLDWTVLARLDRPTIRTYQDEDDLAVYLALDISVSMDFGEPTKFAHARTLAEALGFVALVGQDAAIPIPLGGVDPPGRALRGRASYASLCRWLDDRAPNGRAGLASAMKGFASGGHRAGMVVLLSDGLDADVPAAIRAVASRGHEIAFVHVLSNIERDPDLEGDLRLLDSETGDAVEVTAHSQTLREYKRNLDAHSRGIEDAVTRAGGRYLVSTPGEPITQFVTHQLRKTGLAR